MEKFQKYPKLLTRDKSALLIVDIQERIYKVVRDYDNLVSNILKLIKGIKILGLPIYYTEQYAKGLGPTIQKIKSELEGNAIHKLSFSCYDAENLFSQLKNNGIEQVIVCGIESHVCVLQTVLDLLSNNFQVNIAVDCVSSRKKIDFETALRRMENEGALLSTSETILFELLQVCGTPVFKEISRLVK